MLDPGSAKAKMANRWYVREYIADVGLVDEYYGGETPCSADKHWLAIKMQNNVQKHDPHMQHLVCFRMWDNNGVEYQVNTEWKPYVEITPFG